MEQFVTLYLKIFFMMTPFFILSVFLTLTKNLIKSEKQRIIVKTSITVLITSLIFLLFGRYIFSLFGITLDLWGTLWNTALQRKVPRDSLSRVSSFDAIGSMILRPVGLAIAAPFSIFFGIENFLYALTALTVVVITLSLLSSEVRNMSFDQVQKVD